MDGWLLMTFPPLVRFALTRVRDGVLVLLLVTLVIFILGSVVGNPVGGNGPHLFCLDALC